jgi:hypothetical protein
MGILLNAKSGDVIQYYKSDNADGISLNPKEISVKKYKIMLWKTVKDILEIAGYDIAVPIDILLCLQLPFKTYPS